MSRISRGAEGSRPGCIRTGAPVSCWAVAAARRTFRSFVREGKRAADLPYDAGPDAGVPPTPSVSSVTIWSANSDSVRSSISFGWTLSMYQPAPITTFQVGRPGDARKGQRVAPYPEGRRIGRSCPRPRAGSASPPPPPPSHRSAAGCRSWRSSCSGPTRGSPWRSSGAPGTFATPPRARRTSS